MLPLIFISFAAIGGGAYLLSQEFDFSLMSDNTSVAQGEIQNVEEEGITLGQEYERWGKRIDEVEAEAAYEEFKKEYSSYAFNVQHPGVHVFGELLYRKMGLDGVTVCDSTFAFGCYHAFFGQALAAEGGLDIVPTLNGICFSQYGEGSTGCQHGIGHGLLEYLGSGKLVVALEACEGTYQSDYALFGCGAGVFMEYNTSMSISQDGKYTYLVRNLNEENPHEPCNTIVPEKYRPSCYYQLALWWHQVLNGDVERVGFLCNQINEDREKQACYRSTGNIVASSSGYNVNNSLEKCAQMQNRSGVAVLWLR